MTSEFLHRSFARTNRALSLRLTTEQSRAEQRRHCSLSPSSASAMAPSNWPLKAASTTTETIEASQPASPLSLRADYCAFASVEAARLMRLKRRRRRRRLEDCRRLANTGDAACQPCWWPTLGSLARSNVGATRGHPFGRPWRANHKGSSSSRPLVSCLRSRSPPLVDSACWLGHFCERAQRALSLSLLLLLAC